jgi:hypothetical protein
MFHKTHYEDRLSEYNRWRAELETENDPIQAVIDRYNDAPTVSINADPWDSNSWFSPWELILQNEYCEYCKILGMCYTLQLLEIFKDKKFEIRICIDTENRDRLYLLFIDNKVIGFYYNTYIGIEELPDSIISETVHKMPNL